tara:strand:- start:137 stop:505 length:369 start_codon:yes stop_codon:yes gene_type:complete
LKTNAEVGIKSHKSFLSVFLISKYVKNKTPTYTGNSRKYILTTSKELKYKFGNDTKFEKPKMWLLRLGVNSSCTREISVVIKSYTIVIGRNSMLYGTLILCAQMKKIQCKAKKATHEKIIFF